MPTFVPQFFKLPMLGLAGLIAVSAAAGLHAQDPMIVTPTKAVQIAIPGKAGKTYRLYSSDNLNNWSPVGSQRRFGLGADIEFTAAISEGGKFYRYVVDDEPSGGLAPWTVSGTAWIVSVQANEASYQFTTATTAAVTDPGYVNPVVATTTTLRTGENTLRLTLNLPTNLVRTLDCNFITNGTGTILTRDVVNGVLVDTSDGIFMPPPTNQELLAAAPFGLDGRTLLLHSPSRTILAAFAAAKKLPIVPASIPITSATDYLTTGADTATFIIRDGTQTDSYQLKFTNQRKGTFLRKRVQPGLPPSSQSGVFLLP